MVEELGRIVGDLHYGMPFVCLADVGENQAAPLTKEAARKRAEFRKYDTEMVERFNNVLSRPMVKDVQCEFGWVSYEDGKPVSGVS